MHIAGAQLFLLAAILGGAQAAAAQPAAGLERVEWLTGCWEMSTPERVVEEHWLSPRGGTMINVGRTVSGGKTTEHELVIIRPQDGRLAYEAHPSDQPPAVFLLKELTGSSVVFENAAHDFPQRVGYERRGPDSLLGWIEGARNGKTRRVEFPYRRVACPGPGPAPASPPDSNPPLPSVVLPPDVDRVLRDYEKAWQARDAAALAGLFAEDGFVMASGRPPVRGRDAIRAAYANAGGQLSLRALAFSTVGDIGYIIGAFGREPAGPDTGKFVLALKRGTGGRWLIMADMDNSSRGWPQPTPTPAAVLSSPPSPRKPS